VRVKVGGGIAGHNGLRSISSHIGNDYRRVRIGIGHPGIRNWCTATYCPISPKSDRPWVEALCRRLPITPAARDREGFDVPEQVHLALQAKGFFEDKDDADNKSLARHRRT